MIFFTPKNIWDKDFRIKRLNWTIIKSGTTLSFRLPAGRNAPTRRRDKWILDIQILSISNHLKIKGTNGIDY